VRVVVEDRNTGLDARPDDEQFGVEVPTGEGLVLAHEHRHGGRDANAVHVLELELVQLQEAVEQRGDLVGRALGLRRHPPVAGERAVLEDAEDGLRVAYVDG
jgi:hypothetical protein